MPREAHLSERSVKKTTRRERWAAHSQRLYRRRSPIDECSYYVLASVETAIRRGAMPSMKLDAVSVTTTNLEAAAKFYTLLGFAFPSVEPEAKHLEAITPPGEVRLMIDDRGLIESLTGRNPAPATHSCMAVKCESPAAVNA